MGDTFERKTYVQVTALTELMRSRHLNNSVLARKLGMNRSTVFRARNGNPVGERFITGLLMAFPEKRFGELFFCAKFAWEK